MNRKEKISTIYEKMFEKAWLFCAYIGYVVKYLGGNIEVYAVMDEVCYSRGEDIINIINNWDDLSLPIEEQSSICVDFIYNLLK